MENLPELKWRLRFLENHIVLLKTVIDILVAGMGTYRIWCSKWLLLQEKASTFKIEIWGHMEGFFNVAANVEITRFSVSVTIYLKISFLPSLRQVVVKRLQIIDTAAFILQFLIVHGMYNKDLNISVSVPLVVCVSRKLLSFKILLA